MNDIGRELYEDMEEVSNSD